LIDLVYGRPIGLEEGSKGVRNNLIARLLPIIGRSKLHYLQKNLHGVWWSEAGKKGKERGLIQAINEEVLNEAEKNFLANFRRQPEIAARDLFRTLSAAQLKKPDIRYFADSTPVNIMQANYLHRLFPDALFINMVRDGRDVALSVANEKWGPKDPYTALEWWGNRVLKANIALDEVRPGRALTVRLENLVSRDRDQSLEEIIKFLEIEPEEALLEFFNAELTKEKLNEGLWRQKVANPAKFDKKYSEVLERLKEKGIVVEKFY
jgi:hypothetical protein